MVKTLSIYAAEAENVVMILKVQGYIQHSREASDWVTTPAGEEISGSKMPRYTNDSVDRALSEVNDRIKRINEESGAKFRVTKAVAFGDFLSKRARVQAPDIG